MPETPQPPQGDLFRPAGAPSFIARSQPRGRPGRGWWPAVAALAVLAGLQWLWVERDRLAADPEWRPRVERACAVLPCTVPVWHQPAAFQVASRDVRPHPSVDGALLITATFRNDAPWAQAWPQVELSLSDLEGRVIGLRRFAAVDYLGGEPTSPLLEPGQSARIALEVVDEDRRAVAFAFAFH